MTNAFSSLLPRPFSPRSFNLDLVKNIVCAIVCLRLGTRAVVIIGRHGLFGAGRMLGQTVFGSLIRAAKQVPGAGNRIQAQLDSVISDMEKKIAPLEPGEPRYLCLPETGLNEDELKRELVRYRSKGHVDYRAGKVSGTVYHGGETHDALLVHAYSLFSSSNPLHPEIFPGVRKMEAESVAMVLNMYNAPPGAAGAMTSGGTESILMACKAYRELGASRGIVDPEIVAPASVHAAFDKACHYFKIKLVHIPIDVATGTVSIRRMESAINGNTVMIVGSAPGFPHGIIDDISSLSDVAVRRKVGLHVDCCLGGFLLPFMEKAGFDCPLFDFRLPGVTSISCDTHKYGFAPKGSSVVMYRTKALRRLQYFVAEDWIGGVYASPSIAGSRPGALIAGCWASMMKMGLSGYVDSTKKIIGCARRIETGIREKIPQLQVIGKPIASVVSFRAIDPSSLDVFAVSDAMSEKGWNLNVLQFPSALHIACTLLTVPVADSFIQDLSDSVRLVLGNPKLSKQGQAAVYGMAATVPDRTLIRDVASGFVDCLYVA